MTLRVLVSVEPRPRDIYRLLRRHNGRILAVAIVIELENPHQAAGLSRAYGLRPVAVPPALLIQPYRPGEAGE